MRLTFITPVAPAAEGLSKVTALCWSPNNRRLATVTTDRVVHLFDENGEYRDRFSTKPADKGPKNYLVVGMAFSPDSTKLAVAQSDCIVFVYKLGLEWGDKKSICNKFLQTSTVTCMAWPVGRPSELVFGLSDGAVRIGQLRSNKPATLYETESYVVAVASNSDGSAFVTGHLDGSIYRFSMDDIGRANAHVRVAAHSCVPYALSWGHSVLAAGSDGRVVFYDTDGTLLRTFDYGNDTSVREFGVAAFNPSGESVVVGNFNKFFVYALNQRTSEWEEAGVKAVENYYTVSALAWKADGSRLAVGTLCGVVDVYDACIRRTRYKGTFEFTYVSLSQVIVRPLASGARIVLKSSYGCEITKINIFQERYLVAHTPETLLLGDLETHRLSEIPWAGSGRERFFFDCPSVCMVFNAGELSLIEYGSNDILGSCRTEYMNPHLISVRINERPPARYEREALAGDAGGEVSNKKIAFLLDVQTIRVLDLTTGITAATINHDAKVDWLELNGRANMVLFRDRRRRLHLYDIHRQQRSTLLSYCNYVQWVPDSDVVVAQNRDKLCVWYNITAPDKVTIYEIKGDVEDIERTAGKTEVVVDEGMHRVGYELEDGLIAFGTAVEDHDLERAVLTLERLRMTPETEVMWTQLSALALEERNLTIAQRCAAALGDVARARFLYKTRKLTASVGGASGAGSRGHWAVRYRMALLAKDFRAAEGVLVDSGRVDEAIEMYQTLHRWEEAIAVAEARAHPEAESMRQQYFQYLLDTNQEEKAAALKEATGDYLTAINLYLKGGFPAKAVAVVIAHPSRYSDDLFEKIVQALQTAGMYDKAGGLLERMNQAGRALDAYKRGHAYRNAVELARHSFPREVVVLERAWADWLVSQKQVEAAINHYIEAGAHTDAINAALNARQFKKAAELVRDTVRDPSVAQPFYRRIAHHYEEAGSLEEAEKFYKEAGTPQKAVEMYTAANRWDAAHAVAMSCMSEREVARLYIQQAQRLEAEGKLKDAERLYVTVNEPDLAINMYKKARKYDQMIRLVTQFRKDLLKETHLHLAQQLEMEVNLKEAEAHYAEAGEWESAVNMYRSNDLWEEAFRVAKFHGGASAANRVAYAWALALGGEMGANLLNKLGLVEQAIDYAIESGAFDHAFQLARSSLKKKVPDVHLKHALYLEDEGRFKEAEEEFIKAGKPKEAIDMYIHQQDWSASMRVAEAYDPASISDVLVAQGRVALEGKTPADYARAEALFVDAKKPEFALHAYMEARMFPDAIRVTKKYLPHKLQEVQAEIQSVVSGASRDYVAEARMWEESRNWSLAIDAYLNVTAEHISDLDALEEVWENAVKLASTYEKRRYEEVVVAVAQRLMQIGKYLQAGDLFKDIDQVKDAVDCYVKGDVWDKARALAAKAPLAQREAVEQAYQKHLASAGEADALLDTGAVGTAVEMFVARGEWHKVFEVASKQGGHVFAKYAFTFARQQLDLGGTARVAEVVSVMARFGAPPALEQAPMYERIVHAVLSGAIDDTASDRTVTEAREFMYRLVDSLKRRGESDASPLRELERLLLVLHYMALRIEARALGLSEIAARLSVSLLRFAGVIPADRAFFEAGIACRSMSWLSMAFVMLNRYLDISEAIEDGDASSIDNSDFMGTDIPSPYDFELPKEQFLPEAQRNEIRDWVLAISMDRKVDQSLTLRPCHKCRADTYEASLTCSGCKLQSPACIVSGYPIQPSQLVTCRACDSRANKAFWNMYVVKNRTCPWCKATQSPVY